MRKRQTFLLTILSPEAENASFCGRLKVISTGKTSNFTNLNELYQLIATEMDEEEILKVLAHPEMINGNAKEPITTADPS